MSHAPAGWYEDPEDPSRQRYWSGTEWTDDRRLPPPVPAVPAPPANGFAVTSLIVGIVGALLAFIPLVGLVGFLLGAAVVVFGILGRSGAGQADGTQGAGMATAGIVLGAVAMVLAVATTLLLVMVGYGYSYDLERGFSGVGRRLEAAR